MDRDHGESVIKRLLVKCYQITWKDDYMNPALLQLRLELSNLVKYYNLVKDKYKDVVFLSWISVEYGKEDYPVDGEFVDARKDPDFRNFRASYKKCDELVEQFSLGIVDTDIAFEYRKRLLNIVPNAVPF